METHWKWHIGCVEILVMKFNRYDVIDIAGNVLKFVAKSAAVYLFLKYVLHI